MARNCKGNGGARETAAADNERRLNRRGTARLAARAAGATGFLQPACPATRRGRAPNHRRSG
ncbi:hypothetical protein CNX72_37400 [Burkholderia pseudomallei]|nr:hypothetical protein CXQ84_35320 [Burkholderia pseudomallei]AYE32587.1 hypothetical protein CNX72_37400 [Burkholderia pseudomallei]